jgi:putative ABC transport system ATP-binding protein
MPILQVEGLRKVFGEGALTVTALEAIDFTVEKGELMALLGPSGSGKSTLLLCLSLILEPTAGRIIINNKEIYNNGWTNVDARRFRRENIGFIFQGHNLIPFLTTLDNVALVMTLNGVREGDARKKGMEILEYLEIAHRADFYPSFLSGGEQQRVAIARAIANEPALIFADEPTASLDTERGFKVMGLLKRIAKEKGSGVITVTHDHRMIDGFDTVYELMDGRFVK